MIFIAKQAEYGQHKLQLVNTIPSISRAPAHALCAPAGADVHIALGHVLTISCAGLVHSCLCCLSPSASFRCYYCCTAVRTATGPCARALASATCHAAPVSAGAGAVYATIGIEKGRGVVSCHEAVHVRQGTQTYQCPPWHGRWSAFCALAW
jgi:hypothetical protein